ncbi:MAG: RidA family protein [Candidatus Promineifilaceae bacterium]
MKTYRNPPNVHRPLAAYTHQIEISGSERLVIFSGQVGQREDNSVPEDPIEQLDVAFENLFRNLQAAEMGIEDIVKLTFYLVGDMDAAKRREVTTSKLQGHEPCMTLLYVAALASPIYKVEIDAWASSER